MTIQIALSGNRPVAGERWVAQQIVTIFHVDPLQSIKAMGFCHVVSVSRDGFVAQVFQDYAVGDGIRIEMKSGQLLEGAVAWVWDDHIGVTFYAVIDVDAALSSQDAADDDRYAARLPRLEVDCQMRLRCGGRFHTGRICNISQSGAQVQLSGSLAPEASISVMLKDLPPISASVRWTRRTRAGLSFSENVPLDPLARWLEDRRANWPDPVAAEQRPSPYSR